jgi:hypothetical protein
MRPVEWEDELETHCSPECNHCGGGSRKRWLPEEGEIRVREMRVRFAEESVNFTVAERAQMNLLCEAGKDELLSEWALAAAVAQEAVEARIGGKEWPQWQVRLALHKAANGWGEMRILEKQWEREDKAAFLADPMAVRLAKRAKSRKRLGMSPPRDWEAERTGDIRLPIRYVRHAGYNFALPQEWDRSHSLALKLQRKYLALRSQQEWDRKKQECEQRKKEHALLIASLAMGRG